MNEIRPKRLPTPDSRPQTSLAPLAVFRITFGLLMLFATLRFWAKGWIYDLYIAPGFHFKYYGFEWVHALPGDWMYAVFALMAMAAVGITLGFWYRLSAILFFLSFTYVELLDVANYLNHYYFVSLVSFLMIFLPAHRISSLDLWLGRVNSRSSGNHWFVNILRLQLALVYFYAGLAKLNPDWLLEALPLKIWLPANADLPVIGFLLDYEWVAYAFSWFGALYDLSIPFFLWNRKTRSYAFFTVIVFHLLTWLLFPIGVFPWVMIFSTLIFFSDGFHGKVLRGLSMVFGVYLTPRPPLLKGEGKARRKGCAENSKSPGFLSSKSSKPKVTTASPLSRGRGAGGEVQRPSISLPKIGLVAIIIFILFQALWPWRFLAYPGNVFWHEQGYRLSWRVMLMEKAGYVTYHITDPATGRTGDILPGDYLTENQQKQLATQPDLILQFAHYLEKVYQEKGVEDPIITAEAYVTLNGRGSRLFIDPKTDLTKVKDSFAAKNWILDYGD